MFHNTHIFLSQYPETLLYHLSYNLLTYSNPKLPLVPYYQVYITQRQES